MANELAIARASLVRVECGGDSSGAVVGHCDDDASLILTCAHAVAEDSAIEVFYEAGGKRTKLRAAISGRDVKLELCLLRTVGRLDAPALGIAHSEPAPGELLAIAHCPNGRYGMASVGEMQINHPPHRYYFTAPGIWMGSSGAPLTNHNGALVGVMREMEYDGQTPIAGIGIAVSLRAIKRFLKGVS